VDGPFTKLAEPVECVKIAHRSAGHTSTRFRNHAAIAPERYHENEPTRRRNVPDFPARP
jgi:hypothetical protein